MRVATFWFNGRSALYSRYARVWEATAPRWFDDYKCTELPLPDFNRSAPDFLRDNKGKRHITAAANLSWEAKIEAWHDEVQAATEPILLTDIDVAFFGDPWREANDYNFDVAWCGDGTPDDTRNTGAVYFRPSKKARGFMTAWRDAVHLLMSDEELYRKLDHIYYGLDQSALGYLMETGIGRANTIVLPRRFHSTWKDLEYVKTPYVVHYHGRFRRVIAGEQTRESLPKYALPYFDAWTEFEK